MQHSISMIATLGVLLVFSSTAVSSAPIQLTLAGTGTTRELDAVTVAKSVYLSNADICEKLPLRVQRDTEAGLLVLSSVRDCVPAFVLDSAEVLQRGGELFVRGDLVAQALGCRITEQSRRTLVFACPPGLMPQVGSQVGEHAPGFVLLSEDSTRFALAEQLGRARVVLLFIRSAEWDPFSQALLALFAEKRDSLYGAGFEIVAIHGYERRVAKRWKEKLPAAIPLLSDDFSVVMRAYEVFDRGRLPHPACFALDRDGVIRARIVFEDLTSPPDWTRIQNALRVVP